MGIVKGIFASNISGKVGNVVFRKNGTENIVSQRPAHVKNPRSEMQQRQRAYIKSVASAYSVLRPICDHSFEGIAYGGLSMNFFNKVNYPLVSSAKKAVLKNSTGVVVPVSLMISKGSIIWNENYGEAAQFADITKYMAENNIANNTDVTLQQLLDALQLKMGDQLTIICVVKKSVTFQNSTGSVRQSANIMYYSRYIFNGVGSEKAFIKNAETSVVSVNPAVLAAESEINDNAVIQCKEGLMMSVDINSSLPYMHSAIISRKSGDKWLRSSTLLQTTNDGEKGFDIDDVLLSYNPTDERYLNNAEK